MQNDLEEFGRDLSDRVDWLLREVKKLRSENERLLRENMELREEVTLRRLQTELEGDSEIPADLLSPAKNGSDLPPEALEFYRSLPDKINFNDFFDRVESSGMAATPAREVMLSLVRAGLLAHRGRRIEKTRASATLVPGDTEM